MSKSKKEIMMHDLENYKNHYLLGTDASKELGYTNKSTVQQLLYRGKIELLNPLISFILPDGTFSKPVPFSDFATRQFFTRESIDAWKKHIDAKRGNAKRK